MITIEPGLIPDGYGEAILPLAQAKAHLNVIEEHDDDLIEALRDAAVDLVERYTGLFLGRRTGLVWRSDGFAPVMRLGRGPQVVVTGIQWINPAGVVAAVPAAGWRVEARDHVLAAIGSSWPDAAASVTVTFEAGYTDVSREAPGLIAAARMMLAHLYDNRDAVSSNGVTGEVSVGFRALCDMHRMPVIA